MAMAEPPDVRSQFQRRLSSSTLFEDRKKMKSRSNSVTAVSVEHAVFDLFKEPDGKVTVGKFLNALATTGIRKTDPRLSETIQAFTKEKTVMSHSEPIETLRVDKDQFKSCISHNFVVISRILRNTLVFPEFGGFCEVITDLYYKCEEERSGNVADYIPQLARTDPEQWAVALCTVDGQRYSFGPCDVPFCIQSVSKTFNYALALNDLGSSAVHQYVGQEPSGRIFNDLCLDFNNKPHNPMINAGAIVTSSLLKRGCTLADRYDYVLNFYKKMSGHEFIGFNNAVFLSERSTADRNFALAHFMKEYECFPDNTPLKDVLDFYFQLCSVEVTADSAAVMAATLANGGICPTTDYPVLESSTVRDVLSLMYSCGMYDYSGHFAFNVGLPAKSGVSGVVLLVIPNVMGMCCWSPRLDKYGNSVRGVKFCEELIRVFKFHNYDLLSHVEEKKLDPRRAVVESRGQQVVNLLFSAADGDVVALRQYMLQGIDLGKTDYDSRTALHLAAAEGHIECVRFLLQRGNVDPEPKDRWNTTPAQEAERNGFTEIGCLIDSFVANKKQRIVEEVEEELVA